MNSWHPIVSKKGKQHDLNHVSPIDAHVLVHLSFMSLENFDCFQTSSLGSSRPIPPSPPCYPWRLRQVSQCLWTHPCPLPPRTQYVGNAYYITGTFGAETSGPITGPRRQRSSSTTGKPGSLILRRHHSCSITRIGVMKLISPT